MLNTKFCIKDSSAEFCSINHMKTDFYYCIFMVAKNDADKPFQSAILSILKY